MIISKLIRTQRAQLGISQEELARRINVHQTYISGWERGKQEPSFRFCIRLARAFGLTLDEFARIYESNDDQSSHRAPEIA